MIIRLAIVGFGALAALLAQAASAAALQIPSVAILGCGGTLIAWLLSRQIAQLDGTIKGLGETDKAHERRLNAHGRSIAVLKSMAGVPIVETEDDT